MGYPNSVYPDLICMISDAPIILAAKIRPVKMADSDPLHAANEFGFINGVPIDLQAVQRIEARLRQYVGPGREHLS